MIDLPGVLALTWKRFFPESRPLNETIQITFFNQLTFSVPHLQQVLNITEKLKFNGATIIFYEESVQVRFFPPEPGMTILGIDVCCRHLDWQVSSVAQNFNAPRTLSSAVEFLWPRDRRDYISSEWSCQRSVSYSTTRGRGITNGVVTRAEGARISCD